MSTLFLIPARKGSKGIPEKNYKLLAGKPLVQYSLEMARAFTDDSNICISTNDEAVIKVVQDLGYDLPFIRPDELSTDTSGSYEVLLHAIDFYKSKGVHYDQLILLQPTSPFRTKQNIIEATALYERSIEMVVSVKESKANPYYTLMEENNQGWLVKSKPSHFTQRQDAPVVYELNGAIYIINIEALEKRPISEFVRIRKYVMDEYSSVDLDTPLDWLLAEAIIENKLVHI